MLVGQCISTAVADEEFLELNARPGLGLIGGVLDHCSQCVDLGTGELVDYVPPLPGPEYEWNKASRRWELSEQAKRREQTEGRAPPGVPARGREHRHAAGLAVERQHVAGQHGREGR